LTEHIAGSLKNPAYTQIVVENKKVETFLGQVHPTSIG